MLLYTSIHTRFTSRPSHRAENRSQTPDESQTSALSTKPYIMQPTLHCIDYGLSMLPFQLGSRGVRPHTALHWNLHMPRVLRLLAQYSSFTYLHACLLSLLLLARTYGFTSLKSCAREGPEPHHHAKSHRCPSPHRHGKQWPPRLSSASVSAALAMARCTCVGASGTRRKMFCHIDETVPLIAVRRSESSHSPSSAISSERCAADSRMWAVTGAQQARQTRKSRVRWLGRGFSQCLSINQPWRALNRRWVLLMT